MLNTQAYTVKLPQPDAPSAPTVPVSDDVLDTFGWQWTPGFEAAQDYEIKTPSQDWKTVTANPHQLSIDNTYQVGQVQVRVRGDGITGRAPSMALLNTQAYTVKLPQPDAPRDPEIVNTSGVGITNGLKWNWVAGFSEAAHYEYTHDGGLSWIAVNSNPQHMGPQAYAKDKVQIRVRANAKATEVHRPGKTMDATAASGQFVAMEFVPMLTVGSVVTISESYHGSNQYRFANDQECWAQFDLNGEGEPSYWGNKIQGLSKTELVDNLKTINQNTVCGLIGWDAPPEALVKASTATSSSGNINPVAMSLGQGSFWANVGADYVVYNNGAITTPSPFGTSYYPYWTLVQTDELVARLLAINNDVVTRFNSIENREVTLNASVLAEMVKTEPVLKNIDQLEQDMQALNIEATALATELDAAYVAYRHYVDAIIHHRPSTTSERLADLQSYLNELQTQQIALGLILNRTQASIEALQALAYLLNLNSDLDELTHSLSAIAGESGQALHGRALALYQAIHQLQQALNNFDAIYVTLIEALDSGVLSDGLNIELDVLAARLLALEFEFDGDVAGAQTSAMQALARAKADGYTVSAADAVVGTHFIKLDINGDYLPSTTRFVQGWRCVSDTRFAHSSRIWSLLADGLPGGKDNLAFDDGTHTGSSVMGTGGLLQRLNDANYCGRSDWRVPDLTQTATLATSGGYASTIDTRVFPHHLALTDEYDKYRGGIDFFYWLNKTDDGDDARQQAFAFRTSHSFGTSKGFFDKSASESEDQGRVFITRFVSATSAYELIDINGSVTRVHADARCVRDKVSGSYWQLFDDKGGARFKQFNQLAAIVDGVNATSLCGLTTWAIPSFDEIQALYPFDKSIFINNELSGNYPLRACYVSSDESTPAVFGKKKKCLKLDGTQTSVTYEGSYDIAASLYRLRGK